MTEDGFHKFFGTLAQAIVFATLLVSLGKLWSNYYLIYFMTLVAFGLLCLETYYYLQNKKKRDALNLLKSCSHSSLRGKDRKSFKKTNSKLETNKHELKDGTGRNHSLGEVVKMKTKLKSPKSLSSLRQTLTRRTPEVKVTTDPSEPRRKSIKRPKSIPNLSFGRKQKSKSVINLSNGHQSPTLENTLKSPKSLSNLTTLEKKVNFDINNNSFEEEKPDSSSVESGESTVKKKVNFRQRFKSRVTRAMEKSKRMSLPHDLSKFTAEDANNNDGISKEDFENLKKLMKVSTL